jgi:hypothetical protein
MARFVGLLTSSGVAAEESRPLDQLRRRRLLDQPRHREPELVICGLAGSIPVNFEVGTEIFHVRAQQKGVKSDTDFNVGAIFDFSDSYHQLLSAGHTMQGPSGFLAYSAFQVTFGPKRTGSCHRISDGEVAGLSASHEEPHNQNKAEQRTARSDECPYPWGSAASQCVCDGDRSECQERVMQFLARMYAGYQHAQSARRGNTQYQYHSSSEAYGHRVRLRPVDG